MENVPKPAEGYAFIRLDGQIAAQLNEPEPPPRFGEDEVGQPDPAITVGVGDVLQVTVFESGAGGLFLPVDAGARPGNFVQIPPQQVGQDGAITVPWAGRIRAVGRSPIAIQAEIAARIASRALEPQVIVSFVERHANQVSVLGDVYLANRFSMDSSGERLLGAIARAGGPRFPAYETLVTLQRNGTAQTALLSEIAADPAQNIAMRQGDTVYVAHEPRYFLALGATGQSTTLKLAYFVHDLNDPAVHRRLRMLQAAGASVTLFGFWRGEAPHVVEGILPVLLGRTRNGQLLRRGAAVLRGTVAALRWRKLLAGTDAIIARQIETLVLAVFAGQLYAPTAPVVFERLDIHRLMRARGLTGWLLREVERRLLPHCQALMISSPAFVSGHFARTHANLAPAIVVENKVLSFELDDGAAPALLRCAGRPAGPPWRIGWYGNIRCARSLRLLADLAVAMPGVVEVVIRGRIATNLIPDFDAVIAATPGLTFGGFYDRRYDLGRLYGGVHFTWAIDFYEAGGNSDWLLPNRLYARPSTTSARPAWRPGYKSRDSNCLRKSPSTSSVRKPAPARKKAKLAETVVFPSPDSADTHPMTPTARRPSDIRANLKRKPRIASA